MCMNSRANATTDSTVLSRAEARARITELDAQISSLLATISALLNERDAFQEQLDSYIYPVLALPNEIVSEIFTHFIPVYPKRPPLVGRLSPSILGQVCRQWREIAVSTPSLWRAICLDLSDHDKHLTQLQLLKTWLERSGVSPLSIDLYRSCYTSDVGIGPFIDTVASHTFHCEEMKLYLSLPHVQFLLSQNLPVLHTLTVNLSEECPRGADHSVLFEQAPNLTNVTLGAYFPPFRLVLPWVQITTLHATKLLETELFEILRLAANLVHCSVGLIQGSEDDVFVIAPHMHLQDLTFTVIIPFTSMEMGLLDKLTLPALRNLQIPEPWISPTPCATLAAWISRSSCDLEQLHITHSGLFEVSYREALPSIRKIVVDGDSDDEEYYDYPAEEDSDDDDWTNLFPLC
ncbi:hypothetical protein FB451DRAFT_1252658 [Mycena latifolia]|nr:hypothetical protein FB451DRAFT_1252658 [Mycena latifolia]